MNPRNFLLFIFATVLAVVSGENIVGLKNFGETCYANAVFQLLYHNKSFRQSLAAYLRETGNRANPNLEALNRNFLKMDEAESFDSIVPSTYEALPSAYFARNKQYDVEEVLAQYQAIPYLNWSPFAIEFQENNQPANVSSIEIDLELFLNVPEIEQLSFEDLLDSHFTNTSINALPQNLIVRIKRLHSVNGIDEKITTRIPVPESLSLHQFSSPEALTSSPALFKLDSFIEHCGDRANGGHYLFYLHHQASGAYYAISDEKITEISRDQFLNKAAYAYMYLFTEQNRIN